MEVGNGLSVPLQWQDRIVQQIPYLVAGPANFAGGVHTGATQTVPANRKWCINYLHGVITRTTAPTTEGTQDAYIVWKPGGVGGTTYYLFKGKIGAVVGNYANFDIAGPIWLLAGDVFYIEFLNNDVTAGQTNFQMHMLISEFST